MTEKKIVVKGTNDNENDCSECCESVEVHEDLLKIVNDTIPEETELYDLAELYKVFGDSTRIKILFVLFESHMVLLFLLQH